MTHAIEPLYEPFSIWLTELNWFFQYDSKTWFFSIWLKELIFDNDLKNSMFEKEYWRKDLNLSSWIWRKELHLFLEYDAKNCSFPTWLKELNFCSNSLNQRFELCFFNMTQRVGWFFCQYDSKNCPLFSIWFKELNAFFCHYDSKNCPFFLIWFKELNALLKIWLKELNAFFCKRWLKESNAFFFLQKMTQRIERFENMTQRIELFWKQNSQNWTIFEKIWLAELNHSFQHDRTFLFNMP